MKLIETCVTSPSDLKKITDAANILVGTTLIRARYISPRFAIPQTGESCNGFDITTKGVELSSVSHVLAVTWWMEGTQEGLRFTVDPVDEFYEDEDLNIVDMSQTAQWKSILNSNVVSTNLSWQLPSDDSPKCAWSFRLDITSGRSLTLALGGLDEAGSIPQYQPDSVAVIFDDSIARKYWILASNQSAWGSIIA